MEKITGSYFSENSELKEIAYFNHDAFQSGVIVYEVVRVMDGIVLFFEDHMMRLLQSISLSGFSYRPSLSSFEHMLASLVQKNTVRTGNIKITLRFDTNLQHDPALYAFLIPHTYPDDGMYLNGVVSDFFKAERLDPNVKKMHHTLIERINSFISNHHIYDALLVSQDNSVTEGSRTNVFFIRNEHIFTAPGNLVLKGITREKVVQIARELSLPLDEQMIPVKSLPSYDAAFFTGTSPKILPISRIADLHFNVHHPLLRKLMQAYDDLMANYISQKNRNL